MAILTLEFQVVINTLIDHVDEVEAALHFDECKLAPYNAKSQST